jgi:hypothetical protein
MVERILVVITTTSFVMPNFGIKIAKNNYNVESDYEKLIMFSKHPVLKLKSSGTDTAHYTAGNTEFTVTIPHNLGYVPVCFVYGEYFDVDTESVVERYSRWNRWIYRGVQVADLYYYYADDTNLYIKFEAAEGITDAFSFDLDYMYHIFYDEDNL